MTQFTTILDQESGIQFDGVQDSSEENNYPIHGLIIGKFRRGRFDRSMTITEKNIRGVLGHDSKNPYYRMVQDVLNSGVDSIQVLRVPGDYFDIKPAPIFGSWILNPGVSILNGVAAYTGYKTNTIDTYDSHANLDLTAAIVQSLYDADMQQWQAVKDAVNQLTGGLTATWNASSNSFTYQTPTLLYKSTEYLGDQTKRFYTAIEACTYAGSVKWANFGSALVQTETNCIGYNTTGGWLGSIGYDKVTVPAETREILPATLAQKIISNVSLANQAISLLAEAYLEAVASSIYNADESKQFVKLTDLDPLFETNKVLRVL